MSTNDPREPRDPRSPDRLEMRGRVAGVTRVGPRAIALGAGILGLLLIVVIYGVNKTSSVKRVDSTSTSAPQINQGSPAPNPFANVPLAPTPGPSTEPPPPLLAAPTPVPNVEAVHTAPSSTGGGGGNAAISAAAQAESQREAALQAQRDEEEKARRARIAAAYRAPIFAGSTDSGGTGGGGFIGSGGSGSGTPVQLAASGLSDAAGGLAGGGGLGSGGGFSGSGGFAGSSGAGAQGPAAQATPNPNAFLAGPVGQFPSAGSGAQSVAFQSANPPLPGNPNAEDYLSSGRTGARSPYQLTAGTVIPAAMITGLDSELPGLITAQVREDVYDTKSGKYLLIPRGTRLVGLYKAGLQNGASRVLVTWSRLIFPDTSNIDLQNMLGHDTGGFAGFGGTVDNHTGKIIGAVLLSSIITAAFELTNPQSSGASLNPTVGQTLSSSVGTQLAQTTNQLIQKQTSIPPVVYVPKGYPFLVMVDRDMVFPGVYQRL